MAKRKLTQQQTTRIRNSQRESAARVGTSNKKNVNEDELGAEQPGLIIAHFGRQVDVEALDGEHAGTLFRCHLRTNMDALVTGDRVVWRPGINGVGVVIASQPRHSLLARPDSHLHQPKPVAANIDRIIVVIAPEPEPFANLIDRYLIAAEATDIPPLLLLNKCDLLDAKPSPAIEALIEQYRAIGYSVLRASTKTEHGLDEIRAQLRDRISVFVGQSGVGKSSLIGALIPGLDIRIGALSEGTAKGRHTTTTARLFHLPEGGDLVDSPGIREFGLEHLNREQIEQGFIEFHPWLGHCKFRDCQHSHEPGCALKQAVIDGHISAARFNSFFFIVNHTE